MKMGGSVKTHLPFLEVLASSSKQQAIALLNTMSKEQMNVICEVIINIRYGNIPMSDKDKKRLHHKRDFIRQITTKTTTQKVRRQLIEKESLLLISILKTHLDFLKTHV